MNIGVLASGRGSNFESIAMAVKSGRIKADLVILIVNRKDARAIQRAERYGIGWMFVDPAVYSSRDDYDRRLVDILRSFDVDLVCLAGYMRIVTPHFVDAFRNRIMNIHPALLPSFVGLHAQRKAVKYGVRVSGASVHFVDYGVDTGPIIVQAVVPVSPDDSESDLSSKILDFEHRIYPQAVKWYVDGRIRIDGRKVVVEGANYSSLPVVPSLEDF